MKRSGPMSDESRRALLLTTLQAAVPLHIAEVDDNRWGHLARQFTAHGLAHTVAGHGDDLMYGGKHCAETFNALARGLALLAYQPGGVAFQGLHWCVGSGHNGIPSAAPCAAELARAAVA